jgi:hypothetical protein
VPDLPSLQRRGKQTPNEKTKMLNNAIIESFCVHARNVIEFLEKSYVSKIYTGQAYKYQRDKNTYSRISAQITHLVYDGKYQRAILEREKIGLEERANILNSLADEVEKFKNSLSQAFSHVAIPIPVRVSVPKPSFMGTVTTTTAAVSSFIYWNPPKPEG